MINFIRTGEHFQTEDCDLQPCQKSAPIELDMPVMHTADDSNETDQERIWKQIEGGSEVANIVQPDPEIGSGTEPPTTGTSGQKPGCGVVGSGDSDGSDVTCDQVRLGYVW